MTPHTLLKRLALPVLVAIVATGCATNPAQRDAERLALYRGHAGEPVDTIRYPARYTGWTPLGDEALALWTRPGEAWLLELSGPCQNLDYALTISIRSRSGWLTSRFDDIYAHHSGMIPVPCRIQTIRPLDVKAIRADEKKLREVQRQEAEDVQSAGG